MLGDVADPGNSGRFEANVWVEAASDGTVDDRLFLLFEELDDLLLRTDQSSRQRAVGVEKANDQSLLLDRRDWRS